MLDGDTTPLGLLEQLQSVLRLAESPQTLAEIARAIRRPAKVKVADHQAALRTLLDEEVRRGRAHAHPSGAGATLRYWSQDERQVLGERVLATATTPLTQAALVRRVKQGWKGVDALFVAVVVQELLAAGKLHKHPLARKGPALLGAAPPPPPPPVLHRPAHRKKLDRLLAACRSLLDDSGVAVSELLATLQGTLAPAIEEAVSAPSPTLEALILNAVERVPVLSIAQLRREMPAEMQGAAFDAAVLRLADQRRVIVGQDAHPARYTPEELAEFVADGDGFLTTIARA